MTKLAFVTALIVANWASCANGADFTSSVTKQNKSVVALTGEIAEGDATKLAELIKAANAGGREVSGIRLNSPGGNLAEGAKIAEIVRYAKIATVVPNAALCASACFIIYAAGNEKYSSFSASVGVHGASDRNGNETPTSGTATVLMARLVKEYGVPAGIIGKMVVTPPDQMVWLSPSDLRSMGTTMTGKPAQTVAQGQGQNQNAPSGVPMQLDPKSNASVPAQTKDATPTWEEIVRGAIALAGQQNSGGPTRICQPELKVCNTGISWVSRAGKKMLLRVAEDINGRTLEREVCEINNFGDVRTCFDWDSGAKHRDMKNGKGDWYKVADE